MTDQDDVWLFANAAVDGAVLEVPKASDGAMSPLQRSANEILT